MDVLIPKKKWSFVARWWWLGVLLLAGTNAAGLYWPRPGQRLHIAVSRLTISPVTRGKADYDIGYFGEYCRAPAARPTGRVTPSGKVGRAAPEYGYGARAVQPVPALGPALRHHLALQHGHRLPSLLPLPAPSSEADSAFQPAPFPRYLSPIG
jgi:hypothetical protein